MHLTRFTDYSLRVLIFAGLHRDRQVSIQEISDAYRISRNHLLKVVHTLGKLDLLTTTRGRNGGIRLARPPASIRIGDVVRRTEPDFTLLECFDAAIDTCPITPACRLRGALAQAAERFLSTLDAITLADLLKPNKALSALLDESRP